MTIRIFTPLFLLVLTSFAVSAALPEKSELESIYDRAFREFDAEHYDQALKALDEIDLRQPNLAESLNLRGVVLMRQGKFDKAEAALRKAVSLEPRFWNASFNLAEIPFLKKDWGEARNRFESLMAGQSEGHPAGNGPAHPIQDPAHLRSPGEREHGRLDAEQVRVGEG